MDFMVQNPAVCHTAYDNENAIADEQIVWGTTFEFYLK